jgi:cbb3-type cytochrome oxidase maturation protein
VSVLFVALPVALLLGAAAAIACVRCIAWGQFDDLQSPQVRMLIDEHPITENPANDADDGSESRNLKDPES